MQKCNERQKTIKNIALQPERTVPCSETWWRLQHGQGSCSVWTEQDGRSETTGQRICSRLLKGRDRGGRFTFQQAGDPTYATRATQSNDSDQKHAHVLEGPGQSPEQQSS